jgi:hypothetical protein
MTFAAITKPDLMKALLLPFIIFLLFLVAACNQGGNGTGEAVKNDTTVLTVLTFLEQADSCIEKPVIIEGTVLHLCKHGGKRMFLVDETDSLRVEITAGPNIVKFDDALVGSRVRVTGILKEERIDAKYLNEWEAEVMKPEEDHSVGIHTGTKGHEDHTVEDKLAQINALREDIRNSGKDHLSFFSVEAENFIELK